VIEKTFSDVPAELAVDFEPKLVIMNMDNHERLIVGPFTIELVRITHSIPESSVIVVDTPVGRIINTGDWRLDPEPLDQHPTDVTRLRELGDEGVLLLMSDSTNASRPGRTPTEHTLQESFHDLIGHAEGRVFVAIFSSNMNRIQMIINAAVASGRRVAIDGRSMISYAEIAVRQGLLKIPAGTVVAMKDISKVPDDQVLVVCTGGQGEPGAALQRMADGDHNQIKLHAGDTVIISSTPIPGNEIRYAQISAQLVEYGVHLYRHATRDVDGCGPLHVSGHAAREEYVELIDMIKPKYFLPIYADSLSRKYHADLAIQDAGMPRKNVLSAHNGDTLVFTKDKCEKGDGIPHGTVLVDQTGAIVSNVVVKDRIMMSQDGLVTVVLTVDRKTGQALTSPDIISRGFIYMRDNEELMNELRGELRRAVQQRFKRIDLDRFKQEIREHVTHFLYDKTQRSPIIIPVVNVIGKGGAPVPNGTNGEAAPKPEVDPQEEAISQAQRFAQLRQQLLNQDSRTD
jgi:ribonuclease J